MHRINKSSTAYINTFFWILLQDSDLPRIFPKFTVAVSIHWVLDSAVDSLSMASTALFAVSRSWYLGSKRSSAADMARTARLVVIQTVTVIGLPLQNNGLVNIMNGVEN